MTTRIVQPARRVAGTVQVPGDKSISHRAALLGALAQGNSQLDNFLESADCLATLKAVEDLGVTVKKLAPKSYEVHGKGLGSLRSPTRALDMGNSGTGTRLLAGLLAGQPGVKATITGDNSLLQRPMGRILDPLAQMGALVHSRSGGFAPLNVEGKNLHGAEYTMPMASAQVKSTILIAGLQAQGKTILHEPAPSRDHTERMMRAMGAHLELGNNFLAIHGPQQLRGSMLRIPGDPSSAAFLLAAALLVEGSCLTVEGICLNPSRIGFLSVLKKMGARIEMRVDENDSFEPTGSVTAQHGALKAITLDDAALVANIIDEIPILAVLAAKAHGVTEIRNAQELRVKESDRISALCENLRAIGVRVDELPDGLRIVGPTDFQAAEIHSHKDHRIAMSFAIAGLCSTGKVVVSDTEFIDTSFPGFFDLLARSVTS